MKNAVSVSEYDMKTILIVDDEDGARDVLARLLRRQGHNVVCASNGKQALDLLRAKEPPDLIILDVMMPIIDGFGVLESLRDSKFAATRVIMFTADCNDRSRARALSLGANAYLLKGTDYDTIQACIQEQLAVV
jgi:CheY-like chemotaxis protein